VKPIHIMRFAPADFLLDAFVLGCIRRRAWMTLCFYFLFLLKSHVEGGSLPDEPETLADHLGMREADVADARLACIGAGKLTSDGGRLLHKRVARGIADELAFRAQQAESGAKGGRPPKGYGSGSEKASLSDTKSPPTPTPNPTPTPAPTPQPTPTPDPGGRVGPPGALEKAQAECQSELDQATTALRIPPDSLLAKYSRTPSGATLLRIDTCQSVPWLRTTARRLRGARLAASADAADRPLDGFAALAARVSE